MKGEGEGRADAMGRDGALSCPECARARSGTFWSAWARAGQVSVCVSAVKGMHEQVQGSEREVQDMVVHG